MHCSCACLLLIRATAKMGSPEFAAGDWCAPYAYKVREGQCGGADKWTVMPVKPFPRGEWKYGTGSLYCPKGSYCPNTTVTPALCPSNHHCREGSVAPTWCPPLVKCEEGAELPQANFMGLVIVAAVFLVLLLLWQVCRLHTLWLRSTSKHEEKRTQNGRHSSTDVAPQTQAPRMDSTGIHSS